MDADPSIFSNEIYRPVLAAPTAPDGCFVVARMAQSLDGRIAAASGESRWITGLDDIRHTHRLRSLCDAVIVGAGTVLADDPLLTVREVEGRSPVRIVLDPSRRLLDGHKVFQGVPETLVIADEMAIAGAPLGISKTLHLPAGPGGFDLAALLRMLAARGLCRILVEGGGITVSRFLEAGLVDRLHVTVAPMLLGGGVPAFTFPGLRRLEDGLRFDCNIHRLGQDVLFDIAFDRRHAGAAAA